MRRALAAIALLAMLPNANAQDKAKGEMTHGGEFRMRDYWMMNGEAKKGTDTNTVEERFKLDLGFKPSDKLMANVTLLQNAQLGRATPDNTPAYTNGDLLQVNQVYATWMTSDELTIKAGRMNYQMGDGTLMSINDWEAVPYAFEGVLGNYEAEFGRIQLFLFKYAEVATRVTNGTSWNNDAEANSYGLNFDLKTMPEIIKGVNVHVIKDTSDNLNAGSTAGNGITGNQGKDYLRYGLNVALAFNIVDFKAWYEAHSGKDITFGGGGAVTKTDADGNMMQLEVGANFANFMNSRVFVKYHQDSGDGDTTVAKNETYDPYFYEQHCAAGCMDLYDWGNMTFIQLGWTGKPTDNMEVGLNYWMLSKTKKGTNAGDVTTRQSHGQKNGIGASNPNKDKLGDEIDLWASHKYSNGLTTLLRLSYFTPGDAYNADGAYAGLTDKKSPTEIFLEGRFNF